MSCARIATGTAQPPLGQSGQTSPTSKTSLLIQSGAQLWCCESRWSGTYLGTTPNAITHRRAEDVRLLHIAGPDVHLDSVAHRLTEPQIWPRGITNPHWAPQHMFCGGLTNNSVRRYTSVIPYRDIKGGLAAVVVGRLPPDHGVRAALGGLLGVDWDKNGTAFTRKSSPPPPPANGHTHIFHSERMVCQLSSESWALLAKAYWADYELQESQHLPLEIEAECRKPS